MSFFIWTIHLMFVTYSNRGITSPPSAPGAGGILTIVDPGERLWLRGREVLLTQVTVAASAPVDVVQWLGCLGIAAGAPFASFLPCPHHPLPHTYILDVGAITVIALAKAPLVLGRREMGHHCVYPTPKYIFWCSSFPAQLPCSCKDSWVGRILAPPETQILGWCPACPALATLLCLDIIAVCMSYRGHGSLL